MKKRKLFTLVATFVLSSILFISHSREVGRDECQSNNDCPGALMCLKDLNGYLVCRVPMSTETGGNPSNYEECLTASGNWNMASVCQDSGFERVTCEISGEVSAFGITFKGSFKRGDRYNIPWARYSCISSPGNCCTKQGLYSGKNHLA